MRQMSTNIRTYTYTYIYAVRSCKLHMYIHVHVHVYVCSHSYSYIRARNDHSFYFITSYLCITNSNYVLTCAARPLNYVSTLDDFYFLDSAITVAPFTFVCLATPTSGVSTTLPRPLPVLR